MQGAGPSELPRRAAVGVVETFRRLNFEQRVAGVGAVLLIVSTFGPFSFVEAAMVLTGLGVLFLLRKRAEGREFHVPFGDGTIIAAAGGWSAILILIRLFDRPLGQALLALVCAAILVVAGIAERRKHPPDDLPQPDAAEHQRDAASVRDRRRRRGAARAAAATARAVSDVETAERRVPRAPDQLFDPESGAIDDLRSVHDAPTEPLPPPEYEPPERRPPPPPPPPPPDY